MAYVGSWALTGQRIEGMLGLDQMTNVRVDVARHLEQMRTMDIIQEDEWSVESLFEQQRDQVQPTRVIAEVCNNQRESSVCNGSARYARYRIIVP
jgi:hypothetical protein